MRLVALLLALLLTLPTDACIWVRGTTRDGSYKQRSPWTAARRIESRLKAAIQTNLREQGEKLEQARRGSTSFDDRNDYAVALMFLGRAEEAVALLEKLEAEKPGEYSTAANLGTALELAGRNVEAKKWIEEGIRRDPGSHFGTEWLHVAILDAKIKHDADSNYFQKHSVLNIDYRSLETGAKEIEILGQKRSLHEISEALRYQLVERLQFVKDKDPAVAGLLFDFAAIEAGTATLESAIALLKMAAEYGYPAERIDPLLASYTRTIRLATWKVRLYIGAGIAALLALIIYGFRRRWFVYKPLRRAPAKTIPLVPN